MRWEGGRAGEVEGRRDQLASGNFKRSSVSILTNKPLVLIISKFNVE